LLVRSKPHLFEVLDQFVADVHGAPPFGGELYDDLASRTTIRQRRGPSGKISVTMIRRAFTMRLKPGKFDEYKHHHDNIWPELVAEIEKAGIASITTFRNGDDLFLVSEIRDEGAWIRLWTSEVHRKWAKVMEPLMNLTDDGMVDAGELEEIFHVKTKATAKTTSKKAAK
jgi:L-rhamnose mutarotase